MSKTDDTLHLPNYKDGSIVNLMSSILSSYNSQTIYKPLKRINPDELKQYQNIVLMTIDGLGYEYLNQYGKGSILHENMRGKITSVFPATTATAITTLITGTAPQQHAITGWFVYLKEFGLVTTIMPFKSRCGGSSLSENGIDPKIIFDQKSIFNKIKADSYYLIGEDLLNTDYTNAFAGQAHRISYNNLKDLFEQIKKVLLSNDERKFVYVYWPKLDSLCHAYGTTSPDALSHIKELNNRSEAFVKSIKETNTIFIITADHGFIDVDDAHTIKVKEHPEFAETLVLPICGEPRISYCYVHPSKIAQFEEYVRKNFKEVCEMHKSEELIEKNYFGLFEPHKELHNRIGNYVLVMKNNYVIRDFVIGEKESYFVGYHGGISKEEISVPLIAITT